MLKKLLFHTMLLCGVLAYAQNKPTKSTSKTQTNSPNMLKTKADKFSYAVGLNIAQGIMQQGFADSINVQALAKAIDDILKNQSLLIKIEESQAIIQNYFMELQAQKGEKASEEGKKFLAENAKKKGVITLPSGLQYEVIKQGNGSKPLETDEVTVHYHGTLINGEVFDSSVERGQPATFPVNGVIRGWVEALQLMNEGSKWRLFIPHDLAYGANGAGPKIGPYSTLIFDVELIKVNKK